MLSLLAADVAHIPVEALERAIDRHVATSPYMPKAADLIKLAQSDARPASINRSPGQSYADALCFQYNTKRMRTDIEWAVGPNDQLYLRHIT